QSRVQALGTRFDGRVRSCLAVLHCSWILSRLRSTRGKVSNQGVFYHCFAKTERSECCTFWTAAGKFLATRMLSFSARLRPRWPSALKMHWSFAKSPSREKGWPKREPTYGTRSAATDTLKRYLVRVRDLPRS